MCPPKPPKVENPAAAPAPAAQGADSLVLGGASTGADPAELAARQGLVGRSLLRLGRGRGTGVASGVASGVSTAAASSGTGLGVGSGFSGGGSVPGAFSPGGDSSGGGAGSGGGGGSLRVGRSVNL